VLRQDGTIEAPKAETATPGAGLGLAACPPRGDPPGPSSLLPIQLRLLLFQLAFQLLFVLKSTNLSSPMSCL
jgi:hypothetical protein